jgi:hypothetical protein
MPPDGRDAAGTLADALARGELTGRELTAVARALAELHARARPVAVVGVPALAVERRLTKSFHELLSMIEQRGEIERVLALERFAHRFVVAHAQVFDERARCGHVRGGHGDLRADRVLLERGRARIVPSDGPQADAALDTADDLGALVMELVADGATRLAQQLVRAYRDAGGDPGDDALIAFYAAHRALVRAKVALLQAAEHAPASAAHGHHSAAARDLLAVAEHFAWQARLPLTVVVCGVAGSGKSRLARTLAAASDLTHLRLDASDSPFALGRRTSREIAARGGAIVDAPLARRSDRDAFAAGLARATPSLFIECRAPAAPPGPWEPLDEIAADAHLALRTDRRTEAVLADILGLLDERIGRLAMPAATSLRPE